MPYFQSQYGNIFYHRYGESGPVVLLLHGLASSSRIWIRQVRALRKTCQVYVIDFPGHGQSDRWPAYSFEAIVKLLHDWMDHLGLGNPVPLSIVSLSVGCSVALTFAARYPERVRALVLEGPTSGYKAWWHPVGWIDHVVFCLLPLMLQLSIRLFGQYATAQWLNTFGVKKKRSFKVLERLQNQADFKAIHQLLWQSAYPPYLGGLERITASTLIIRGCDDPMPKRFVRYLQTHLRNVSLIEVPHTRHIVAMEDPTTFNRLLLEFIDAVQLADKQDQGATK